VTTVSGLLGTPPPWPVGLVTAVLAGILLWSVTARLRLRPESRAAATAVYACCALLTELTTADGVDGRATLLLAAGGMFAAAGKRRSVLAALACVGSGADRSSVKVVTPPSAPTVATVVVVPACTETVLATIGGSVEPALRVAIT